MPAPNPPDARIGSMFGNFRILRKLGEGGMGVVYEAENPKISSRAAVKLLHARFAQDEEYAQRFLNEARAVNVIDHRGLVKIFDFGKLPDGTLYYVMEFLEGGSLHKRIAEQKGPLKQADAVSIGVQVARALAAAHKAGIIHRDLKPENIMLEVDPVNQGQDWVKILDFGIAKFYSGKATTATTDPEKTDMDTRVGSFMGTQLYMPPEQHGQAESVDGRADVFALGVVLYELLSGQLPFTTNSLSLLTRIPPPVRKLNAGVSQRLSKLVERMIATRRDDRPTMDEVARQLAAMQPGALRNARLLIGVAGAAGLIVGALLFMLLSVEREPTPAELRNQSRDVLAAYIRGQDAAGRLMALRAVGQSRDFDQRSLLEPMVKPAEKLTGETAPVVEEAARALGQVGAVDATVPLVALLAHTETPNVQLAAAGALAQLQHPRGLEALKQALAEGDELSKIQAALLLMEHRDFSGASLLWQALGRGRLSDERRIEVLGRLARSDDAQAKQRLAEELARLPSGEARIQVAYPLAQLSEESGWNYLKAAALRSTALSEQLLALRLLAGLGDTEQEEQLLALAGDRKQPDSIRQQAMAGLADGGHFKSLLPLHKALNERGASTRLRIAAAGAILKITAGELARLGEQSLSMARAALGNDSAAMRELAVAMLADMSSDQAVALLSDALRDRERDIRRSAARALGRKNMRMAVQALKPALQDTDPEVRNLGMQSIGHILQELGQRGDRQAATLVLDEFRRLAEKGEETDRMAASGVLLQLGEAQAAERAVLRGGLTSRDAQVRRLAIELGEAERPALVKALADSDGAVRLAAAYKLARQGYLDGVPVLRQAAAGGNSEGLKAYTVLRKLGEPVPPPPGLSSLLTSGDLSSRLAVLDLLSQLPQEDALRLMRIALLDPVSVVRRRAAEVSAQLYRATRQVTFLRMLRSLQRDPDVTVRAQASVLAEEVEQWTKTARPPDLSASAPPAPPPKTPSPAPESSLPAGNGGVILDGEELVRVQIDRGPSQPINGRPVSLSPGRHHLSYLGGGQDIQVVAGQTLRVRIPVSQGDQFHQDAKDALGRKDYAHAQEYLDRLRRLVQRGKASQSLEAELSFQQARLYEARQQLDAALTEYNRALNIPAAQRRPELNAALQSTLVRLSGKVGRIQIFTTFEGRCQMTRELLLPPGQQVISLGKGLTRTIYSQVGSINKVQACQ